MAIKFKEIRKFLSRAERVSICFEDRHYDSYLIPSDIPEGKYDDLYVFGVGMVDVEFPLDVYSQPKEFPQRISFSEGFTLGCALEIVLHEKPRDIKREKKKVLTFGDLRNYLQSGKNFSVVVKEDWSEECFEFRHHIPEEYNDMYVWGIGMVDNLEEIRKVKHPCLLDSLMNKKMRIVLSEKPRD